MKAKFVTNERLFWRKTLFIFQFPCSMALQKVTKKWHWRNKNWNVDNDGVHCKHIWRVLMAYHFMYLLFQEKFYNSGSDRKLKNIVHAVLLYRWHEQTVSGTVSIMRQVWHTWGFHHNHWWNCFSFFGKQTL